MFASRPKSIFSDFTFIDNDNITEQHLWKDGIHLKENDKNISANNYLYQF